MHSPRVRGWWLNDVPWCFVMLLHACMLLVGSNAAASDNLPLPACALKIHQDGTGPAVIDMLCKQAGLGVSVQSGLAVLKKGSGNQGFVVNPACSAKLRPGCLLTLCGDALFTGCSVTDVSTADASAILCVVGSSRVTFQECSFVGNTARNSTLHVADTAAVTLSNSTVRGSRGGYGSAVQVTGRGTLHLNSSTLSSNAGQQGGAVYASQDAQLVFQSSSISNNRVPPANSSTRGSCAGGGVLLEGRAQLVLSGSNRLVNNSAVCDVPRGGALALRDGSSLLSTGSAATNSTPACSNTTNLISGNRAQSTNKLGGSRVRMRRNTDATAAAGSQDNAQGTYAEVAAAAGGGVAVLGNSTVALTDTALLNNTVLGRGTVGGAGLVALASSRVQLGADVLVQGNLANGTVTYGAGAWFMGSSRGVLKDGAHIKGNTVTGDIPNGGGIAVQDRTVLLAQGAILEGNEALGPDPWAGAIIAEQGAQVNLGPGTQLLHNQAVGESAKGGAVVLSGQSSGNMTGATFRGNYVGDSGAGIMGGAIYTTQAASLTINNCSLVSNVAAGPGVAGGAVAADAPQGQLVVLNQTLFDSNVVNGSQGKGGALWTQVPTVIKDGCSFNNNTVTGDESGGGALFANCGQLCGAGGISLDLSKDITFTQNSASGQGCMGGAVYVQNAVNLTAQGLRFAYNSVPMPSSRGGFGGALEVSGNGRGVTNITDAVIGSCSAHQGGGVSLEGPLAAYLTDVLITNCTTAKDGGGLFIQNPTQAVVITRVLFRGNTAGYKAPNTPDGSADPGYGGAINAWNVPTLLLLVNATLENNRAHGCGGMVAGRSRMVFNPFVRVTNNTAAERGGGVCVGTGSTLRLAPSKPSVAGLLEQGDAAAATAPEEEKQQLLRMVSGNNAPDGQDFWWTQMCPTGFVRNVDAACRACERDTFSFSSNANDTCRPCPPGAICPGRDLLLPQPGYWHSTNFSTNFKRCPEPEACALEIPGVNNSVLACKEGHQGNLCGECAAEWGLKAPFTCARCIGKTGSIAAYTAAAVALLAFTYLMWLLTMGDNASMDNTLRAEDVLKILTIYAQSMFIISKAKVTWPGLLRGLATPFAFAFTGGTSIMPISCLLPPPEVLSIPGPYVLLLMQLLLPLGLVAGAMLVKLAVHGVSVLIGRCKGNIDALEDTASVPAAGVSDKLPEVQNKAIVPTLSQQMWVLFLVVMFLSYPTMVNAALSLFACHRLDAPPPALYPEYAVANATWGYWENQMSQACYEGVHRGWALAVGIPLALLLVVVWPVYLLVLLLQKRNTADEPRFAMHYGFIYRAYRTNREWWGAVVVVHMAVLVFVSTFMSVLGAFYCTLLLSMLFGSMQGLVLLLLPFEQSRLNWLKLASMAALWLTSNATLAFMPGPVGYSLSENGKNVLAAFMLLVNVVFLVAAFLLLVHYGLKEGKVYWRAAKSWIRAKSESRIAKRSASGRPLEGVVSQISESRKRSAVGGPLEGVVRGSQLPQQGAPSELEAIAVVVGTNHNTQ